MQGTNGVTKFWFEETELDVEFRFQAPDARTTPSLFIFSELGEEGKADLSRGVPLMALLCLQCNARSQVRRE